LNLDFFYSTLVMHILFKNGFNILVQNKRLLRFARNDKSNNAVIFLSLRGAPKAFGATWQSHLKSIIKSIRLYAILDTMIFNLNGILKLGFRR
jgi:hypothetical protein